MARDYYLNIINLMKSENRMEKAVELSKEAYEFTQSKQFEEYSKIEGFINTEKVQNLWDPAFSGAIKSLNAKYFNGNVDRIYGEIHNNSGRDWINVNLSFMLYDEKGKPIETVSITIGERISANTSYRFSSDGNNGFFYLKGKKFELVQISPFGL